MISQEYTYVFDRRSSNVLDIGSYPFLCGFQTRIRQATCKDEEGPQLPAMLTSCLNNDYSQLQSRTLGS